MKFVLFIFFINSFLCSVFNHDDDYPELVIAKDTNIVLPPAWAFGILYGGYTNQEQTIERINYIICRGYPIDAYWIDSWFWSLTNKGKGPEKYIDFVADTVEFPKRADMWTFMQNNCIKGGFWIWDCILKTGNEKAFDDFYSRGYFSNTYIESNPWHNKSTSTAMFADDSNNSGTLCGNINFNDSAAVSYFKKRVKHFFDEGVDFIKLDRTSSIPVCKSMFEITQELGKETKGRGFILSHTGGIESDEYKRYPAKWTDDTRADWNIETPTKKFNSWVPKVAFRENISMFIDSAKSSSKIPFLSNDMGGFDMGITDVIDEELYIRWMQFSFFTPIVEIFAQPENNTSNLPYLVSERSDDVFIKYSHLRMELFPYIYSYAHQCRLTGTNIIRSIPGNKSDYLFGNEILVSPITEKGCTLKKINLPKGNWINFYNDAEFSGDKEYYINSHIEEIPLFVKAGSVIPMRNYARSIELGSNDTLNIHVFTGSDGDFSLFEDDGKSNDYLNGGYSKTNILIKTGNKDDVIKIDAIKGSFKEINYKRVYRFIIHTKKNIHSSFLNGKKILFSKVSQYRFKSEFINADKREVCELIIKY